MLNQQSDKMLKKMVLENHEYDWNKLAYCFGSSTEEIKERWKEFVYPTIRSNEKIAGAYLWTHQENEIVKNSNGNLQQIWVALMDFLPGRTHFSVEARWKRINSKNNEVKQKNRNVEHCQLINQNHKKRLLEYRTILQLRKKMQQNPQMECETYQDEAQIEIS